MKLNTPKQNEPMKGIHFAELLYADDTFLFGTHTQNINKLLAEIQSESAYYNLKLNLEKCINLTANRKQSTIKFADGTPVPRKHKATYLGAILTDTICNTTEINSRIAACNATANKLKLFWTKSDVPEFWKLRVLDAIINSKII